MAQAAQAETTALQQQRQVEHLTEQLRQRELDIRAKQLELETEIVGRKLAESQCAKAENSARQDTECAQHALEVTFQCSFEPRKQSEAWVYCGALPFISGPLCAS